jgi:hypothetical protein
MRPFADDCIICRKILSNKEAEILRIGLNRLGEWAFENVTIINPAKSKAVCFTIARVMGSLNYSLGDIVIPKASSCKYLGIILRSNISWADQRKNPGRRFTLKMRILKMGNSNTESSAYRSLVRPILEYASSCWDHHREEQTNAPDWVQNKSG